MEDRSLFSTSRYNSPDRITRSNTRPTSDRKVQLRPPDAPVASLSGGLHPVTRYGFSWTRFWQKDTAKTHRTMGDCHPAPCSTSDLKGSCIRRQQLMNVGM